MSGPVTRSRAKNVNQNQPEPEPETSGRTKEPATSTPVKDKSKLVRSKASTVSHNISERNETIRSKVSSVLIRKKEAEFAAAKRLAEAELNLERTLVQKELELKLAHIDADKSHRSRSSRTSRSRVQDWLITELHAHEQDEPTRHHEPVNQEGRERYAEQDLTYKPPNEIRVRPNHNLSDIQLLAREIANLRRPTEAKDLPYYNGNVNEWLLFKAAVADIRASSTENEIIAKLRRCLKGEARVTVAALLDTHVPVSEIMEALELRFGLPELILQEELQALKDLPKLVDNTEQLSKFACKVRNCVSTIKALNKPEHLHNMELLRTLKQKMPHLKTRWLTYASEHELDDQPELVKLSEFLKKEAQTTSKYWVHETSRTTIKPTQLHKTHYADDEDSESEPEPEPCHASNQPKGPPEIFCLHCNSKTHLLENCEQFLRLSIEDRWEWAKGAKVCFKCLRSRHHRESCRAQSCGIEGCRMSHNKLLHSLTYRHPETSACVHPSTSRFPTTLEVEAEKPPHETTACSRTNRTQVLLKKIPVRIHGPIKSKLTYAFLDGGSTLTLLKQELADEIGLKGIAEHLSLSGVNTTSDHTGSKRLDIEITGTSDVRLKLYDVRKLGSMPISPQTVAYLPHFGVTNINKRGKLRIVYDDARKVQGVSLHNMLDGGRRWETKVPQGQMKKTRKWSTSYLANMPIANQI